MSRMNNLIGSKRRWWTLVFALSAALVWTTACGSGISEEEFQAVQQELSTEQQKATNLQQKLTAEEQEKTQLQQTLETRQQEVSQLEEEMAAEKEEMGKLQDDLEDKQAEIANLQSQLESEQVDKATLESQLSAAKSEAASLEEELEARRETVAALESQLDSAKSQVAKLQEETAAPVLLVDTDMVRGHSNPQGPTCALTNQYQREEMIVWRTRISDPKTGEQLPASPDKLLADNPTDDEIEAMTNGYEAVVKLEDGQTFPMHFGPHGRPEPLDYFWTASWEIPANYPTGSLGYTISVTGPDGRTGNFKPPQVGAPITVMERTEAELVLAADMVRGHANPVGPTCAVTSRYQREEMVVWRVRITDAETGNGVPASASELLSQAEPPTDDEIAAMTDGVEVVVHLGDGQEFPMHFGPHGRPEPLDYFWTTSWEIPADYPTGTVEYWITAEWADENKSGRWEPFAIGLSKLTIEERTASAE